MNASRRPRRRYEWTSKAVVSVMSCRSECQTEQYLSRDKAMARSTAVGGTSPLTWKCIDTRRRRRGGSGNGRR